MNTEQRALITQQQQTVAAKRGQLAQLDTLRETVISELIKEIGSLEGMQAALALETKPVEEVKKDATG